MPIPDNESGVLAAWVEALESRHLPRLLEIKTELDAGQPILDFDLNFLSEVLEDSRQLEATIARHPQYEPLATRVFDLCHEITEKALARESGKPGQPV